MLGDLTKRWLDFLQNGKGRPYANFQPPDEVTEATDAALFAGLDDKHIKEGGITGVSLGTGVITAYTVDGAAEAGAVAMVGAMVGDEVAFVLNLTTPGMSSDFESVITVEDEIQQSTDDDLSTDTFFVVVITKS